MLPHQLACKASALLVCHDPMKIGKPPWCCPKQTEFWRLDRASWRAAYEKLVRLPGIAPGRAPWQGAILLLNHNRESKRAGSVAAACGRPQGPPGPCHFNKEQTPLGGLFDPNPRFHGGCFGVYGHTSCEALNM